VANSLLEFDDSLTATLRFHLDEHVARAVAVALRNRGVDVTTSAEAGLLGASDEAQLDYAHAQQRVLLTNDTDYLRLHAAGWAHSGIVFIGNQLSIGQVIRFAALLHDLLAPAEMAGRVDFAS
jgi:uncharacterized protein with PIN domain